MRSRTVPLRLLTAVPSCDGHDSAITTINLEFVRHGIEVVYLGYHRSAADIARAAVQEDVRAIGVSSYNGGHVEFFAEVRRELRERGGADISLFGGGGGTISAEDAKIMTRHGVSRIFFPGTSLEEMTTFVKKSYGGKCLQAAVPIKHRDRHLARLLSSSFPSPGTPGEENGAGRKARDRSCKLGFPGGSGPPPPPSPGVPGEGEGFAPMIIGVTGPGGAGKTTLIDELVLRYLKAHPTARVGVLSHDPSIVGRGALLGDRAAMLYCQDDRVFLRSLSTAGHAGGISANTARCLAIMKQPVHRFDVIFVETVGVGQEAQPFAATKRLVDRTILVMSPDYGSRLQLQKIAMLDLADLIVVNKSDLASARTALAEIRQRIGARGSEECILATVASRHRDAGVDRLFKHLQLPCGTGILPV
jgi:methylmalonyl-CoA mutase cobalamin-binding domain/chain